MEHRGPRIVRRVLVAHAQRVPEADPLLEQVDRHRLLARVELVGAPPGGERHDPHRPVQPAEARDVERSEEHTSELQSPCNLVCRLLLEKKKKKKNIITIAKAT